MIKYALKIRLVIAQIVVCCLFFLSCTKNDDAVVKVFNVSVTLQKVSAEEGEFIYTEQGKCDAEIALYNDFLSSKA